MLGHGWTNVIVQLYFENKKQFNRAFSRNNITKKRRAKCMLQVLMSIKSVEINE